MLFRETVHGCLCLVLNPVAHLQPSAVLSDPEVEIGLGASWKALQDARFTDALDNREVHPPVPVCSRLGHCRETAGPESHIELVDLDVLQQAAIATGTGKLDTLIWTFPVQCGLLKKLSIA